MKRSGLILMGLAVIAGLGAGLLYTWVLDPVEYYDSAPADLYIDDKLVYLALIGDIYAHDGNLAQAKARLTKVGIKAEGQTLAALIEHYLDGGGRPEDVRNLARLAADLGAQGGVLLVFDTLATPTPTATTVPAAQPGSPATPTPEPAFHLVEQTRLCAAPGQAGKIAVWVHDAEGNQLPGLEIVVSWPQGQDHFFTGLRPELGPGYADFEMKAGTKYEVTLAGFRGEVATGLAPDLSPGLCPTGTLAVNWKLTFEKEP